MWPPFFPSLFTRYIPIRIEFRIAVSRSFFCSSLEKVDTEAGDNDDEIARDERIRCSRPRSLGKNFPRSNVCVLEDELADMTDDESSSLVTFVLKSLCMLLNFALACGTEGRTENELWV